MTAAQVRASTMARLCPLVCRRQLGGREVRWSIMRDAASELNLDDLDDGYLKVLLLVAVRRAMGEEPRHAGFWHGLAGVLSAEQEKRRDVAEITGTDPAPLRPEELGELETVLDAWRRDVAALEAEYSEAYSQMPQPGSKPF